MSVSQGTLAKFDLFQRIGREPSFCIGRWFAFDTVSGDASGGYVLGAIALSSSTDFLGKNILWDVRTYHLTANQVLTTPNGGIHIIAGDLPAYQAWWNWDPQFNPEINGHCPRVGGVMPINQLFKLITKVSTTTIVAQVNLSINPNVNGCGYTFGASGYLYDEAYMPKDYVPV